jgi:hypothetical protein
MNLPLNTIFGFKEQIQSNSDQLQFTGSLLVTYFDTYIQIEVVSPFKYLITSIVWNQDSEAATSEITILDSYTITISNSFIGSKVINAEVTHSFGTTILTTTVIVAEVITESSLMWDNLDLSATLDDGSELILEDGTEYPNP